MLMSPLTLKAATGDISVDRTPCGSNGAAEVLTSTKALQYLDLNRTYSVKFTSDTTKDSNGSLVYGTLAGGYSFVTTNENNFYEIYTANPQCAQSVEFVLYDENRIKCSYTRAQQTISQGQGVYCVYKLKPNRRYYVTLSIPNGENYSPAVVTSRVRCIPDDVGDNTVAALPVQDNVGYEFELNGYEDVDYFTYTPNGDKAFYSVTYSGMNLSTSKLEIFSQSLEKIATLDVTANQEMSTSVTLQANKRYYFKVSSSDEYVTGKYFFSISKVQDDVKDNPSVATKLDIDKAYTYGLQSALDRDVFSFSSGGFGAYNIEVINNDPNTSNNVSFSIQDQNGGTVGSTSVNGWARSSLELTDLNKNMTYYIFVSGEADRGTTYTLKITHIKRNIKYNLEGGKNNKNNKRTYNINGVTKLYAPTKKNHRFCGWYTTAEHIEGTMISAISETSRDDIELWATWEKVKVKGINNPQAKAKSKNKIRCNWGKTSGAHGYQIDWSTKKSFKAKDTKTKRTKGSSYTIGKLKKNTTYYVRLRPYQKYYDTYFYGKGKTLKVKTKKR